MRVDTLARYSNHKEEYVIHVYVQTGMITNRAFFLLNWNQSVRTWVDYHIPIFCY